VAPIALLSGRRSRTRSLNSPDPQSTTRTAECTVSQSARPGGSKHLQYLSRQRRPERMFRGYPCSGRRVRNSVYADSLTAGSCEFEIQDSEFKLEMNPSARARLRGDRRGFFSCSDNSKHRLALSGSFRARNIRPRLNCSQAFSG